MFAALEPDLAEPALLHRRPGSSIPSKSAPANRAAKRIHATHYNVLFLCADNSVSSTLAEALLRRWGGERCLQLGRKPPRRDPSACGGISQGTAVMASGALLEELP